MLTKLYLLEAPDSLVTFYLITSRGFTPYKLKLFPIQIEKIKENVRSVGEPEPQESTGFGHGT